MISRWDVGATCSTPLQTTIRHMASALVTTNLATAGELAGQGRVSEDVLFFKNLMLKCLAVVKKQIWSKYILYSPSRSQVHISPVCMLASAVTAPRPTLTLTTE